MKRVLIISPHFPPVNAADMHRVRQTLPYFKENGWEAEVIAVDPRYVEAYSLDDLLIKSLPDDIKVHLVKAWDVNKTRKFGLGSLSMRSFFHFRKKGNEVLNSNKFDLIFFSTTAFHVMALGPYWKKKFAVPFVVDIQDPWRSDFYLDKTKRERPPKFWLSYRIDKYLEAKTIPFADGIMSVSEGYIETFNKRYPRSNNIPSIVLPFAGSQIDFDIADTISSFYSIISIDKTKKNIFYIGRGGHDLKKSLCILFAALKKIKEENSSLFAQLQFWFIGTSYAANGRGSKTILPIAEEFGVSSVVTEITDRLPYYETLYWLKQADLLFVPGSIDTSYTASKIFPYILAQRPMLAIFHYKSSVVDILRSTHSGTCLTFDNNEDMSSIVEKCKESIISLLLPGKEIKTDWIAFDSYTAKTMSKRMLSFFEKVISNPISN